jgi:hypothetical protein
VSPALAVLALVALGGAGWYVHVRLYPLKPCPRCGGARKNKSWYAHQHCGRCGQTGEVRRFGAPRGERR